MKILLSLLILTFSINNSDQWSERLSAKIHKSIENTFESSDFQLEKIVLDLDEVNKHKVDLDNNLFEIRKSSSKLGYAYVGQAPSMKNVFDYIVIFDTKFKIINAKVLIYRETHGKQIGSKRWLSQFFGMDSNSRPKLGDEIDGITGATISVNGMTNAVYDLLECIDNLRKNAKLI